MISRGEGRLRVSAVRTPLGAPWAVWTVSLVLALVLVGRASQARTSGPPGGPAAPLPTATPARSDTPPARPDETRRTPPQEAPAAPAQVGPVRIEADVDRKTVTLGDPITVTVRLVHPADVRVTSFDPERSLGDLTLLDRKTGETKRLPDGRLQETRILRVAGYRIGESSIPSFEATFVDSSGKEGGVATLPVPFAVGSTLAEGDTRPADIKNPAIMPVRQIWPWIAAAALAVALAAIWLWRRRRARRVLPKAAAPVGPSRAADEVAYAELERLLSSGLLEKGRVKEFYIELAEILRRYVGARFGVETFERTTAEILEALRLARLPVKGMALTAEFFAACDMVKFAKYLPPSDETRATVERAYRLVDETRPRGAPSREAEPRAVGGAAAGAAR